MRRRAIYIAGGTVGILLLVPLWFFWLLYTEGGARFVLTTLTGAAGYHVTVKDVEGRLIDRLHLSGVRLSRLKVRARIESVDLVWQPRQLLNRDLVIRDLIVSGVSIQDDTPPGPKPIEAPRLRWPQVSELVRSFSARVSRLDLKNLSYRHMKDPPTLVTELTSSLTFEDGLLSLSGLNLVSPDGRVSGEAAAGFWHPSLRLDLSVAPAKPVQEMDSFSLQARLVPGREPEQISGPVSAVGRRGGAKRLELSAELGMTDTAFNARKVRITQAGRRGVVTGGGSMTPTRDEPIYALALQAVDLDLARELDRATRLSGTVTFSGTQSDFKGSFNLTNKGAGWESASLAADYQGGGSRVALSRIRGKLLEGNLSGALDIAWSEGVRVTGKLAGRGLNPRGIAPEWPGLINLDLAGTLDKPEQGELKGKLRGKLLESRLQGRELQGELVGSFAGERVAVERLLLRGKGFDLQGAGELDRRLNLAARVSDLSGLVPGAAGRVRADGWVRWRDGLFSGAAAGEGSDLVVAGVSAEAVSLEARLGEAKGHPLHLDASLSSVRAGRVQIESVLLGLRGTAEQHDLAAELRSPGSEARLTLAGGYGDGVWRGELTDLYGHDGVGPWSLASPAPVMVSAERLTVAPLVINGLPGEKVEAAVDLKLQPVTGDLRGGWGGVNLARANPWLEGMELQGASSGDLRIRVLPGERVILTGRADAQGSVVADGQRVAFEQLTAKLEGDRSGLAAALDLSLQGGAGEAHILFRSPEPAALALPGRGDLRMQWSDLDLALLAPFTSPELAVEGRSAGLVTGKLLPGGRLDLKGEAAIDKGHVNWRAEGEEFDAVIDQAEADFTWRGRVAEAGAGQLQLAVRAAATGSYTAKEQRVAFGRMTLRADADRSGTRAWLDLALEEGGELRAALSSDAPAGFRIPDTGSMDVAWQGIDAALLRPWLPPSLKLEGVLSGDAAAKLLPGRRLEMAGEAVFSEGRARWQGETGEVNANLRSASLSFTWRDEALSGALVLALAEYGRAEGSFRLPIPARLPVVPDQNGALQGALAGRVQERGFLTAFLPGLVQESHGELDLDLRAGGTWGDPRLAGTLQLSKAGAYLPTAGIRVSDLQLSARLEGDRLLVEKFRAVSGKGHIEGNLQLRLEGWQVAEYSGSLSGENFQTVYLPELQMVTSPLLSFDGGPEKVTLRGELRIPEMLVSGPPVRQVVTASEDVILEGAPPAPEEKEFPLYLDGRVRVVLGDKVEVKASGVDARLGGSMYLVLKGIDSISSSGEINVVKGSYRAYGMELEIVRGRLYYVNDPVDQPTLDILALRTVGDVRAGVTVAGSLRAPIVKLYSEPPMPDVDILAYMVLGHPLGASREEGSMVALAASSLLSLGESTALYEQVKDRLGLSVLGVQTVDTSGAGMMGYEAIPVTPAGEAQARPAAAESLLTVGKYLTPRLYLSYGRSLVTGGNLFMLRYDISRHWQLETQSGSESGVDIYYKVEFN